MTNYKYSKSCRLPKWNEDHLLNLNYLQINNKDSSTAIQTHQRLVKISYQPIRYKPLTTSPESY